MGYDRNALYIAVQVRDDSTIIDGTGNWRTQDGCSVYLDPEHRAEDTTSIPFDVYGDGPDLLEPMGLKAASWSCRRTGAVDCYEWRFVMDRISPRVELKPGRVLGLDISVCDRDEDASFSWIAWGPGTLKSESSTRLGDVLLASSEAETGRVRGQLIDRTGEPEDGHHVVRISSLAQTSPVTLISGRNGEFEAVLPVGQYFGSTLSNERAQSFQLSRFSSAATASCP